MSVFFITGSRTTKSAAKTAKISETAKSTVSKTSIAAAGCTMSAILIPVAFRPLFHNLLISLLYFLKSFLRLFLMWIIDISIRVILPAERLICFFYFFIFYILNN